jgi:hypothetical protein
MKLKEAQANSPAVDRLALIGITLVGMAMCTAGVGKIAELGQWASSTGVAGSTLGVAVLAIVGARISGRPLPGIVDDRAAIVAVAGVAAIKVAIAAIFPLGA